MYISRLQFKTTGPDFHAELIPVHSPLLRESYLVSCPPLTYMLKFSGFAVLTSCPEDIPRALHAKVPSRDTATEPVRRIGKLHITRSPYTFNVSELQYHPNTQIHTGETSTG